MSQFTSQFLGLGAGCLPTRSKLTFDRWIGAIPTPCHIRSTSIRSQSDSPVHRRKTSAEGIDLPFQHAQTFENIGKFRRIAEEHLGHGGVVAHQRRYLALCRLNRNVPGTAVS